MKKIATILLSILILYSCSSNNKSQTKEQNIEDTVTAESFKTFDTIVPFSGYWVSEAYHKCLQETRSTRTAQLTSEAISIFIPHKTLQITEMIFGFHEGSESLYVVKNGDNYELWSKPANEIWGAIQIISENKIKILDTYYVNLSKKIDEEDDSVEELMGEFIFGGTYTSNKNDIIEFKGNGEIVGFYDYSYYRPALDYMDRAMNIDQIVLEKSRGYDSQWFAYKFNSDTLFIYELKCIEYGKDELCNIEDFGELKYKLWKK